jgi:type I restriction enzyme S subunit
LASVLVPLPSLEEQRLITTRVREALSEAENALAIMERGQPQASTLRQSILKAGFEGGLAPQDPADEPASALLARLRNDHSWTGARRRKARAAADFSHPSLPGLTRQSVDPRVEPAGDE